MSTARAKEAAGRPSAASRWLAVLLAVAALVGGLAGPAAALDDDEDPGGGGGGFPEDPPVPGGEPVEIDWTMPSRFGGDSDGDGLIDNMTPSDFCEADDPATCGPRPQTSPHPIAPTSWHVDLNACGSQLAHGDHATFTWEVLRGPGAITGGTGPGAPCGTYDLVVPEEGVYRVGLTISSSLGTASTTRDITVQDWLVVSLGDSYGSGEGNPDVDIERGFAGVAVSEARWQDRRCHRSAHAGSAQAARWLEQADPRTSVTFIHVACSGAEAMAGLLEAYAGVSGTWEAKNLPALDPQITQARELVGGREVDATYISIGGNDANFADIVMSCIALAPCNPRFVGADDEVHPDGWIVAGTCTGVAVVVPPPLGAIAATVCVPVLSQILADFAGDTAENHFRNGLQGGAADGNLAAYRLTGIYDDLSRALHATGPQGDGSPFLGIPETQRDRVFISEYVDATQDDEGDYCPKGDVLKPFNDVRIPGLAREEYEWIDVGVERKLNEVIAFNADRNGWNLVDGIHADFATHGICADDSYMVGLLTETLWRQGNITGAAHPNVKGHEVYRNRIVSAILPTLYPGADGGALDIQNLGQVRIWIAGHDARPPAQSPHPEAGGPYTVAEGSSVLAVDDSFDDGPLGRAWSTSAPEVATVAPPTATNPTITGVDDGLATLTLTVTDSDGNVASDTAEVLVTNVAPVVVAEAPEPIVLDEGDTMAGTATYSDVGVLDTHSASIDFGDGTVAPAAATGGAVAFEHTYLDEGTYTVTVTVTDDDGGAGQASFPVTVHNVAPTVEPVVLPALPASVGSAVTVSSAYSDPGADAHTLTWAWGDGTTSVELRAPETDGPVTAEHTYTTPGLYTVSLTVDDGDGGITAQESRYVVVYDPAGGYVTGGGRILSPAGAVVGTPTATGQAGFSIASRYQAGQTVPGGVSSFRLAAGNFLVTATSSDWLVAPGDGTAWYSGPAKVNNRAGYRYLIALAEGDPGQMDRLRLKVWSTSDGSVVYDNQPGAADDAVATSPISSGRASVL